MTKDKKRKIILYASLSGIGLLTIGSVTAWAIIRKKNPKINNQNQNDQENSQENNKNNNQTEEKDPNKIKEDESLNEINADNIFPIIETKNYYDQLNFKDGQAWIDDEMISYIIKDIIGRMTINDGHIKYSVEKIDNQNVNLYFIWYSANKKAYRSYKISTNTI